MRRRRGARGEWTALRARHSEPRAATKHAIEGYSESLDHELRTRGIRVSVIEPAYTKTQFDANFVQPDSKLDEHCEVRAVLGKRLKEVVEAADEPGVVADVVPKAAIAARPKLRYAAVSSRTAFECCADLRPLAWWTQGFESTCSSMHRQLCNDGTHRGYQKKG
jgi:NAD(P)-dependent dehydrogenase (short-subunit alcohol dehydrogenase family)